MKTHKIIGILLIVLSVIVVMFGIWIKGYNDKRAQYQVNETGSCYLPDGTCLHTISDSIMYASIGIGVLVFAAGLYFVLHKKEQGKVIVKNRAIKKTTPVKENIPEIPKTLNEESKGIFDIITQSNGAVLQGEIVTKSGMDKAKVSRILDKLEMQGLIERRRHGMSNLVVLKK